VTFQRVTTLFRPLNVRLIAGAAGAVLAAATVYTAGQTAAQAPPSAVTFYGNPTSPISGGVAIPAGAAFVWTSGTLAPAIDPKLPPETRYGADTKTQALGILKLIEQQLAKQGLTMKDVVYIRAYLVGDPNKGGKLDTDGWNEAYKQYFGTAENPTKTARSTIGVAALVAPGFLLEVEAFAVYPTAAK
jgi:enamine deaminase RidA (YjgF/YER057c/UK114 family)